MTYQVLARKWRPRNFQDMVGQAPILRMLANALEQKRIHHAYLFSGTRGVGKTTLARILAKCLNCEVGISATPCEKCATCVALDEGRFLDLYEVDAASRTKVEDTKELLDNVLYPPNQGRFKVYLIDEVHMLSNHSFNALLKTLEEPPSHVKFLLATTDPKRLPITILSRCLQFHLKRILPEHITQHLQHICTVEKIQHDNQSLEKLAQAADGSMRDALSLLDQAVAYCHDNINATDVYAMLGSLVQNDVLPLLHALAVQNGQQLFATISQLTEYAPDFQQVLEELISVLHKIALAQAVPDAIVLESTLTPFIKQFTPEEVQLYYQIALLGRRDLAYTPTPQQGFEMTMLRMLAFKPGSQSIAEVQSSRLSQVTQQTKDNYQAPAKSEPTPTISVTEIEEQLNWRELLPKLELTGLAQALAANCTLVKKVNNKIQLALAVAHQPMLNNKLKERLIESLNRHFKQPIQLEIIISNGELDTPVKQNLQEQTALLAHAKQSIAQDPRVQKLMELYDATVEVSLID